MISGVFSESRSAHTADYKQYTCNARIPITHSDVDIALWPYTELDGERIVL